MGGVGSRRRWRERKGPGSDAPAEDDAVDGAAAPPGPDFGAAAGSPKPGAAGAAAAGGGARAGAALGVGSISCPPAGARPLSRWGCSLAVGRSKPCDPDAT